MGIAADMGAVQHGQLKQVVESRHGGKATFVQSVPVSEIRGSQTISSGSVSVFDLRGSMSGAFLPMHGPRNRLKGNRHISRSCTRQGLSARPKQSARRWRRTQRLMNRLLFRPISISASVVLT